MEKKRYINRTVICIKNEMLALLFKIKILFDLLRILDRSDIYY